MDNALILSNDRWARLVKWMNSYGTFMLRMCIIYLHDVTLAEVAMQATFLKAYKHMDSLERNEVGREKARMMRIAIKTCRHYRRVGRFRQIGWHNSLEQFKPIFTEMVEQKKVLLAAIMDLPKKHKEVVLLFDYQDMTVEDVGICLGLSKPSVQYRLNTAMGKLRMKLERWYFDE